MHWVSRKSSTREPNRRELDHCGGLVRQLPRRTRPLAAIQGSEVVTPGPSYWCGRRDRLTPPHRRPTTLPMSGRSDSRAYRSSPTVAERVAAIPPKRAPPPETRFLERDEITTLFARLPSSGRNSARDRALLLFLYNTGARVQEAVDLRVRDLDLVPTPRVRLHGKGDKWRACPL